MSDPAPVSERHRFDAERLTGYLTQQLPGFKGPVRVTQFQGGQSNPTYLLATPDGGYVMRSKPAAAAKLLPRAHAIEREFRVMQALAAQGIPVPHVHLLCEDESVIGRAFFLMEYVAGRIFFDQSLPGLSNTERGQIYDEMNRVIAALHRIDIERAGLADFGGAGNYFERQISRWSRQYRASETEPIDAMNRLMDALPQHIPPGDESAVVHGDFRMDNLIFSAAGAAPPRIVAVIDWELSTIGHPLADFSFHCMGWRIPPGAYRGTAGLDLAALGIPSEAAYIRRYCERTGRDRIDHWNFFIAYNLFRMAAILQGIYKRGTDGIAAGDDARIARRQAEALADLGWEHVLLLTP